MMFNAFGEGYLCLLKIFLFLSFRKLYFMYILHEIYKAKVLQQLFWAYFFGRPYRSNGIKIHLDAALLCIAFPLFSLFICSENVSTCFLFPFIYMINTWYNWAIFRFSSATDFSKYLVISLLSKFTKQKR